MLCLRRPLLAFDVPDSAETEGVSWEAEPEEPFAPEPAAHSADFTDVAGHV